MASVYCKTCNAKITYGDAVCPSCGAPTSRVIRVVLGIALVTAGIILFSAYRQHSENSSRDPSSIAAPSESESRSSRLGSYDF